MNWEEFTSDVSFENVQISQRRRRLPGRGESEPVRIGSHVEQPFDAAGVTIEQEQRSIERVAPSVTAPARHTDAGSVIRRRSSAPERQSSAPRPFLSS